MVQLWNPELYIIPILKNFLSVIKTAASQVAVCAMYAMIIAAMGNRYHILLLKLSLLSSSIKRSDLAPFSESNLSVIAISSFSFRNLANTGEPAGMYLCVWVGGEGGAERDGKREGSEQN